MEKVYLEGYLVMDLDNVRYSDYTGAPTETMSKTQSLLKTQKLTDYISIIMGDQPVDYFDTFAETFNNIGGAKSEKKSRKHCSNFFKNGGGVQETLPPFLYGFQLIIEVTQMNKMERLRVNWKRTGSFI